jgi:putative flippase GtrA
MLSVSALLVLYVVGMSLAGEGKTEDEREQMHRWYANRAALIAGTIILSVAILYQLFTHNLDYWLLVALIGINLTKIVSLIFLNYKK